MTTPKRHLHEPGHVSVIIHGADEETVTAFARALAVCHNVTDPSSPWRVPGQPGVHVQVYGHTDPGEESDPVTCCAAVPEDCQWRLPS
ncbi:DUF6207 family protein [Streptomyces sp. MZ04]|uniref:DUF6207 family protein n=1 Tax=Streptomyces sp. MZ04 TaxID=2559236 RepID=UPI00107EAB54|nr:DUF6207 family protein [Streptomyces sp. MZ04]TGB03226.1 hypothetical protein E2651_25705 [Streptomyces sp. MZ04]